MPIAIDRTAAQSKILRGILREVGVYGVITSAKGEQICAISASIMEQHMARFSIGDRVKILPTVASPFVDLEGTIKQVLPHDRNVTTLDQYMVVLSWGEEHSFYDVQLALVENQSR